MKTDLTADEIAAIVLAEYGYWRDEGEGSVEISMGAIGACANIYAAIVGHRAPWHPQKKLDG